MKQEKQRLLMLPEFWGFPQEKTLE